MDDDKGSFQYRDAVKHERLELALKASHEGIRDWWTDRSEIYDSRRTGSGDWRWLRIRGTVVRSRDGKDYQMPAP
ncbi:MAG: hypothetical protein Q8Q59_02530 [Luteolibacter sp.]|nr:hypothetical protein [Luteolibacter sp.]